MEGEWAGVPFRRDGELIWRGAPTWREEMAALGEAVARWRRNNPRPAEALVSPEQERTALRAVIWQEILDELYPPGGVEHESAWLRLTHQDLAGMSDLQLRDEAARARLRLFLDRTADPWFTERPEQISAEQARRGSVERSR